MFKKRKPHSFTIFLSFLLLTVYILAQLSWWAIELIQLHKENIILNPFIDEPIQQLVSRKKWMVYGEGSVFLILLFVGMYIIYHAVMKEIKLAQLQKNFLLAITHELKTPIASNRLYLQTLLRKKHSEEVQIDFIQKALEENARLNYLAQNILLSTSIENESLSPHISEFDLSALVHKHLESYQQTVIAKSHQIDASISSKILVLADEQMLISIIQNLLDNAAKYSPPQSTIQVNCIAQKSNVVFSVSNESPNILKKDLKRIFDRFYRIGNEETRSAKGTGLGLYIVKNLCELHKGSIKAINTQQGICFTVELPIVKN